MPAINTLVSGSIGTCIEAADWLDTLNQQGHATADKVYKGRDVATSTWFGPASYRFIEETQNLSQHSDHIAEQAHGASQALREFASSLEAINNRVDETLGVARSAGLRIDGPFIIAPTRPAAPEIRPTGPCGTGEAQKIMQQNQQALAEYEAGPLATYQAQAAAYNKAKAIMEHARTLEKNAHHTLQQAMGAVTKTADHEVSAVFTAAANARNYVGESENPRRMAAAQAERLRTQSAFLKQYGLGTVPSATPVQQRILDHSAKLARDGGKAQLRAQQFEKWVTMFPEKARTAVTAYPGKAAAENLAKHTKSVKIPSVAAKTLRSVPYVGAGLTIANEAIQSANGQQSWARGAADTGATVGGGALGAVGGGAALGSVAGLPGMIVGGLLGGVAAATIGQDVVEGIFNVTEAE